MPYENLKLKVVTIIRTFDLTKFRLLENRESQIDFSLTELKNKKSDFPVNNLEE